MIDHVVLNVSDLAKSRQFYENVLATFGYEIVWDLEDWVGFGKSGKADFWIALRKPQHTKMHVAFRCDERSSVNRFFKAAIQAGGEDNGPPGVRKHYHESYYAAFVFDPDGNNIETVCHKKV